MLSQQWKKFILTVAGIDLDYGRLLKNWVDCRYSDFHRVNAWGIADAGGLHHR